jgi:LacI family transcriptional regulator
MPKVHLFSTHYFSEILSGIGMKLGEAGYGLLLLFQAAETPKNYIQFFHSQKIDGCIILGSRDVPDEVEAVKQLEASQLPYCLVNQTFQGVDLHSIDALHSEGSFQAVSHLINKGLKRIAFLNGPLTYSNSKERLMGYQAALHAAELDVRPDWLFQGNYSRKSGYAAASLMQSLLPNLDAVFAANDRMAIGLMQGLSELGYRAGDDYALVGYDDSDASRITDPPLSTVKVPFFEMGTLAADTILNMLDNKGVIRIQERLPVQFIERASSQTAK